MSGSHDDGRHPLDPWVPGIRDGSEAAFRAVYDATADDLASFANGMLRNRTTAEDMVQQAFLELVRAAPTLRGGGESLRVWLFKSVRFRCLDEIKRAGRRRELPVAAVPEQVSGLDGDALLAPELERALAQLTERQRMLVVLRHVVGLDGNELADVMEMTRSAVYAAVARAEAAVRRSMGADDGST